MVKKIQLFLIWAKSLLHRDRLMMESVMAESETTENADIVLKVLGAQVGQLYQQSWVGLVGVLVVAFSVSGILFPVLPTWKICLWLGTFTLISFARGYLIVLFQRTAPVGGELNKWANWHVIGSSASGVMWALPSFFLWPENSPEFSLVWALCILPLGAAAVSTYYTWQPSYITFLLLSAVPVSLRFFFEGGLFYVVLGCLTMFFVGILVKAGSSMHHNSLSSLIVGFRNEALSSILSCEKEKQEELTHHLQKAHDQLYKISLTDELTGLWNRRYFNKTIHENVAQVLRNYCSPQEINEKNNQRDTDILFIMVDLDHFKDVNDTYGHGVGDLILKQMSSLLKKSCRDTDTIIRWGGEEFLIVSQNVCRENYTILVERIQQAVEHYQFDIGKESPFHLTCSIGASVFPFITRSPDVLSWDRVVELSDACLYAVKRSGRNGWIAIDSTDLITNEDITPEIIKYLSDLIDDNKIAMTTNLTERRINWADN